MSMLGGPVPPGREDAGEPVASYPSYEGAQKAVSALIAADVPAKEIAIVGRDLRSVERVTGRLGYATAARSGAVNGVLLGLLFSFVFTLGTPTVQITVFLGVMLVGVAIGMLMSIIAYSIVRRRRDFASVMQVAADRYEVCVPAARVAQARQITGAGAAPVLSRETVAAVRSGGTVAAPEQTEEPPRYGERIPPRPSGDEDHGAERVEPPT